MIIRFSAEKDEFFCIGMKVFFKGIPNQVDSTIYLDLDDRYSILSYCSISDLPDWVLRNSRWMHKRVYTFEDYSKILDGPFLLQFLPRE